MTELQDLLKQAEKSAKAAKESLTDQERAISRLPDGFEKNVLKQAAEKARKGDLDGVKKLIQTLQNGA